MQPDIGRIGIQDTNGVTPAAQKARQQHNQRALACAPFPQDANPFAREHSLVLIHRSYYRRHNIVGNRY
jgi:hypothetical protein